MTIATSFSSSIEYCASSTLRWLSAVLFAGWLWTRKLRNGSRLRSLSTKSFSVYSGAFELRGQAPRSWPRRRRAVWAGGGGAAVDTGVPQALQTRSATERPVRREGRHDAGSHLDASRRGRAVAAGAPAAAGPPRGAFGSSAWNAVARHLALQDDLVADDLRDR